MSPRKTTVPKTLCTRIRSNRSAQEIATVETGRFSTATLAISPRITDLEGELPTRLLSEPVDRLEVAEFLRAEHRLKGKVAEFEIDELEFFIVFKGPG